MEFDVFEDATVLISSVDVAYLADLVGASATDRTVRSDDFDVICRARYLFVSCGGKVSTLRRTPEVTP